MPNVQVVTLSVIAQVIVLLVILCIHVPPVPTVCNLMARVLNVYLILTVLKQNLSAMKQHTHVIYVIPSILVQATYQSVTVTDSVVHVLGIPSVQLQLLFVQMEAALYVGPSILAP